MNRKAGITGIAALVLALVPGGLSAQAAAVTETIWDGVYTAVQAERGETTVQSNCSSCHTANEWASAAFIGQWSGRPIHDLHDWLRGAMPLDGPGRLSAQEYADVVAYMLQLNSVPAGEKELPADAESLAKIQVTPRSNTD